MGEQKVLTDEERRALVEAACDAADIFTEDELEAYAEEIKKRKLIGVLNE